MEGIGFNMHAALGLLLKKRTIIVGFTMVLFVVLALYAELVGYLYHAAYEHMRIMLARRPIAQEIATGNLSSDDKAKLRVMLDVRGFASRYLGLPDNGSYTVYSDIGRENVGWNIYAAPKLSVVPRRWCFPIAGCVVYRGFFAKNDALAFARRLSESEDLDVYVGAFNAYSTLGYFNDPVLSSHLALDEYRLAALIIHELAHQRLYIPGNSRVNEAFATVVEREGLVRWMRQTGREASIPRVQASWDAQDIKIREIVAARDALKELYGSALGPREKEIEKAKLLDDLSKSVCTGGCSGITFPKANENTFEINNAYLVPFDTYFGEYDTLRSLLMGVGGDFERFYREVQRIYD